MDTWIDRVIEEKGSTIEEVRQTGFIRWMLEKENQKFDTAEIQRLCDQGQMRFDPELQKRQHRGEMQQKAQKSHTGEARWTNMDQHCFEAISSGCAIVGFFVGYGPAQGKQHSELCTSRKNNAECTINWEMMPPLCRKDNVDDKNAQIAEIRQKKKNEAAGSSRVDCERLYDTHDDCDPCDTMDVDWGDE